MTGAGTGLLDNVYSRNEHEEQVLIDKEASVQKPGAKVTKTTHQVTIYTGSLTVA